MLIGDSMCVGIGLQAKREVSGEEKGVKIPFIARLALDDVHTSVISSAIHLLHSLLCCPLSDLIAEYVRIIIQLY